MVRLGSVRFACVCWWNLVFLALKTDVNRPIPTLAPLVRTASTGRVRERLCRHSLPSEPDVKVSLHPAQAATKPCVNRAGQRGNFPRDLDDMDLQPADRTHT